MEKHRIALSSKDADHLNEKDAWQKSMDMLQTKTDEYQAAIQALEKEKQTLLDEHAKPIED